MSLDLLKLETFETSEGNYYLYPEYTNLASKLSLQNCSKSLLSEDDSSRNNDLCISKDGSFRFVAKYEREEGGIHKENYPDNFNLSLKEISIARALSQLVNFSFENLAIEFEKPIGYYEGIDGRRVALFEYNTRELEGILFLLSLPILKEIYTESVKRRGTDKPALFKIKEKYSPLTDDPELDWFEKLLTPYWLADVILRHNAVYHNEWDYLTQYHSGGNTTYFVTDFELVCVLDDVCFETQDAINKALFFYSNPLPDYGTRLERLVSLLPEEKVEERRAEFLSIIDTRQRVLNAYFDTEITSDYAPDEGVASEIIKQVPELVLEGKLIK